MTTEEVKIVEAMRQFGGGFVQALAVAFQAADTRNFTRLRLAFQDVWSNYTILAAMKGATVTPRGSTMKHQMDTPC